MLQLFKNNQFANALVLLPIAIGLQVSLFFGSGMESPLSEGWLYDRFISDLSLTPVWNAILTGVLVFFQAIFINRLSIIHRLNNEINILPGFIWLFWSAMHPEFIGLSAIHPALLCVLLGMNNLMRCFKKRNRSIYVFNTGFFLSLGSLFYFPVLSAMLFGLFMLFIFLSIRFPEPQQYLAGIFVPYFLALCTAYYLGEVDTFIIEQWSNHDFGSIFSHLEIGFNQGIILAISALILVISIANLPFYHAKKEIFSQRKISMLFLYILFALIGILFVNGFDFSYLLMLLWPATIFISDNLYHLKNGILAELVLWLFIALSFFMQYEFLF